MVCVAEADVRILGNVGRWGDRNIEQGRASDLEKHASPGICTSLSKMAREHRQKEDGYQKAASWHVPSTRRNGLRIKTGMLTTDY